MAETASPATTATGPAGAAKKRLVRPPAELQPGPDDQVLGDDELAVLGLFQRLKRKPSAERLPGSIVLRRFARGAAVCRQGERGHSAFYILSRDDLLALKKLQLAKAEASGPQIETPEAETEQATAAEKPEPRQVATAHVLSGSAPPPKPRGLFDRLNRMLRGAERAGEVQQPSYIPNDGPVDINYQTRQAPMHEGDVFGEMSCLTLAPRSATVVADADCYMLEFLRNIYDQIQRDAGYREWMDKVYEQRVLTTHLQRLQFFRDLSDEQLELIRSRARLSIFEPGQVICDEQDPSDSVYVIRSGMVQVVKEVNVALAVEDIKDWPGLCRALLEGESKAKSSSGESSSTSSGPTAGGKPSMEEMMALARAGKGKAKSKEPTALSEPKEAPTGSPPITKPSPGEALQDHLAARDELVRSGKKPPQSVPERVEKIEKPAPAKDKGLPAKAGITAQKPPGKADPAASPRQHVWQSLPAPVQQTVRDVAAGKEAGDDAKKEVLSVLHDLMRSRVFLAAKSLGDVYRREDVHDTIQTFPKGEKGIKKDWSDVEVRIGGRLVLQEIFPEHFPNRRRSGPPTILAYLSRGDCFGEMGVVKNEPRSATCIAYDHPPDDPNRKSAPVELVRIPAEAFHELLDTSAALKTQVSELIDRRAESTKQIGQRSPWDPRASVFTSPEFRDEGFIQGQKLLLIDLDRCTRCGDCVSACINTHDDGYTRLFLDGPRFDRFLVPSACRQCLNPACMIGCPVGSIQRGDNGQILIRDWCIGCGLCARQCPYDSIQMHDIGIIPDVTPGWRFTTERAAGGNWNRPGASVKNWQAGFSPFHWDLDLQAALAGAGAAKGNGQGRFLEPLCFRYEFKTPPEAAHSDRRVKVLVTSKGLDVAVWLNGQVVELQQNARQQRDGISEAFLGGTRLEERGNVVAVRIAPPADKETAIGLDYGQTVLSLRMDLVPELAAGGAADTEVELVAETAVVCDLCSSLPNQEPACVAQCPHDAAMRVDARFNFPLG